MPVGLLPFTDPIQAIFNILLAIPTGIDDALSELTGNPTFRPLGTAVVTSPFGVGGPALPDPPPPLTTSVMTMSTPPVVDTNTAEQEQDAAAVALLSAGAIEPGTDLVGGDIGESEPDESGTTEGSVESATVEDSGDLVAAESTPTEKSAEKKSADTLRANTPSLTQRDRPKVRGPVEFDSQEKKAVPSPGQPGQGETTTSEPESTPDDAASPAAA